MMQTPEISPNSHSTPVNFRNAALGASVVLTLVFASIAAIEYSRAPLISTVTSTETTTSTLTTVSTTSVLSVSTETVFTTAFALSVSVNSSSYAAGYPILVRGSVGPVPNAPTNVTLVISAIGIVFATATTPLSITNGTYSYTLVAGEWEVGVYTLTAICVAFGVPETATTQFTMGVVA